MSEIILNPKEMRDALGDLAKPEWNDAQVIQLYRLLMDNSSLPIAINFAAEGFLLGKLDKTYSKPSDRNVI
ncbi:hypothetical protein KBD69_05030 [Candidatus Woesebacteria bacterium]|nr:hypothetical protein [Candidatus Woesebacteria bacterium]